MIQYSWDEISEYFANGNVDGLNISTDLTSIQIEVVYYNGSLWITMNATCSGCCYFDFRRVAYHEPGSGIVLEAYVHSESPLIEALFAHKLEGKAGTLYLEADKTDGITHLEIVGEITINVICQKVEFTATGMPWNEPSAQVNP